MKIVGPGVLQEKGGRRLAKKNIGPNVLSPRCKQSKKDEKCGKMQKGSAKARTCDLRHFCVLPYHWGGCTLVSSNENKNT